MAAVRDQRTTNGSTVLKAPRRCSRA